MCMTAGNHKKDAIGAGVGSAAAVILVAIVATSLVVLYKCRFRLRRKMTGEQCRMFVVHTEQKWLAGKKPLALFAECPIPNLIITKVAECPIPNLKVACVCS